MGERIYDAVGGGDENINFLRTYIYNEHMIMCGRSGYSQYDTAIWTE